MAEMDFRESPVQDYLRKLPEEQLVEEQIREEQALYSPKPLPKVEPSVAANRAHMDAMIEQDPTSFKRRNDEHLQGNVETLTTDRMRKLMEEQGVVDTGVLDPEFMADKTPEERLEIVEKQLNRIKLSHSSVLPRDLALIEFYLAGGGEYGDAAYENFYKSVDVSELRALANWRTNKGLKEARYVLDDIAAARGLGNAAEATATLIAQELTPILGVGTRINFERRVQEAITGKKPSGFSSILLGELRQQTREALVDMSPTERMGAYENLRQMITDMEADPITAAWLTNYNILETIEALDTEGVADGSDGSDSLDRFFGNFETVVEAIAPVMVVAKLGTKGVRAAFRAGNKVKAVQLAPAAGKPEIAGRLLDELQSDELATTFGLEADELAATVLPRPKAFVNDIDELPEGSKDLLIRNERIRSEILEATAKPELGLTRAEKTNAVQKQIAQLDLVDGAAVQPRMSTLERFEDDSGFRMRVVVGDSANGGYDDIQDAMLEAIEIDPDLLNVNLMRVNSNGVLEPVFDSAEDFQRALFLNQVDPATAGRIAGGDTLDESFYLAYDRDYIYSSIDKDLGEETFLSGYISGAARNILTPNAKFGDNIYGAFTRAYMQEQKLGANLETMFKPYYDLSRGDKRFVAHAFEWMEDFGKNNRRAPTLTETKVQYPDMTQAQIDGLVSMRSGMDVMHELFNRKLYRNWAAQGFRTARPVDQTLPTFHGKQLDQAEVAGEAVLDPVTQKMVKMSRREVDDLYHSGGSIIELDMAIDAAEDAGHKATLVVARHDTYKVGDLSTQPLIHHPGYSIRFYDDPYYVVKVTEGVALNGSVRAASSSIEEAVKTAGDVYGAERAARRMQRADEAKGLKTSYKVVRSNDISQTESSIFQKQAIHREGRLFWDDRNFDRLPDVNGNRAKLEDPVKALERGIGIASRQLTGEDLMKGVKTAWKNEYGHMLTDEELRVFDLKAVSRKLGEAKKNAVGTEQAESIRQAKELLDYMRMLDGVDQSAIPAIRAAVIRTGEFLNRTTRGTLGSGIAKKGQTLDPLQLAKSIAYNFYIVFRPIRQLFLQSSQIGYLSGIAPKYIGSGKVFTDGAMLRSGLIRLRRSGYDDGISVGMAAKTMGLSKKEYRKLVKEFDRSGLTDLVSVHSFAGGASKFKKTELGREGVLGAVGYKARQTGNAVHGLLSKGFEAGEGMNLSFTYNVALNRMMARNKYKSLLEMTPKNWDDMRIEASNMALAMIKTNNAGYQTGLLSVPTQFLSFQHKALLGLINQNPALKGKARRMIVGTTMLYGAGMYGAADYVRNQFIANEIEDEVIPGTEVKMSDLMANGLIETTFNMLAGFLDENWQPLDISGFTPGLDPGRYAESFMELASEGDFGFVLGPTASTGSAILKSINFATQMYNAGESDVHPADKFMAVADMALRNALPAYNDAAMAYVGSKLMQWENAAGEPTALSATTASLLARGLFGIRSKEELAYYNMNNQVWNNQEVRRNIVDADAKLLAQQVRYFHDGSINEEQLLSSLTSIMSLKEDWPEGAKRDLYKDILNKVIQGRKIPQPLAREIWDAFKANSLTGDQAVQMVDRLSNKTEDEKRKLKAMYREAYADKQITDTQTFEDIGEELDGRAR